MDAVYQHQPIQDGLIWWGGTFKDTVQPEIRYPHFLRCIRRGRLHDDRLDNQTSKWGVQVCGQRANDQRLRKELQSDSCPWAIPLLRRLSDDSTRFPLCNLEDFDWYSGNSYLQISQHIWLPQHLRRFQPNKTWGYLHYKDGRNWCLGFRRLVQQA